MRRPTALALIFCAVGCAIRQDVLSADDYASKPRGRHRWNGVRQDPDHPGGYLSTRENGTMIHIARDEPVPHGSPITGIMKRSEKQTLKNFDQPTVCNQGRTEAARPEPAQRAQAHCLVV